MFVHDKMKHLGKIVRLVREKSGLTQIAAAKKLGISIVHLCYVENGQRGMSPKLHNKYQQLWNVDLYVLDWCIKGDCPPEMQKVAKILSDSWLRYLDNGQKASHSRY